MTLLNNEVVSITVNGFVVDKEYRGGLEKKAVVWKYHMVEKISNSSKPARFNFYYSLFMFSFFKKMLPTMVLTSRGNSSTGHRAYLVAIGHFHYRNPSKSEPV